MAKWRKKARGDTFESEVRRQFGPVAERLGIVETPVPEHVAMFGGVDYENDVLEYRWLMDHLEGDVSVTIRLDHDGDRYITGVEDLVVNGKLGVRQDLRSGGRSWRAIQQAIASHITWIERLHSRLMAPDAVTLIEEAGGRKHVPETARSSTEHLRVSREDRKEP